MNLDFRKVLPLLPEPEFPQPAVRAVAAQWAFVGAMAALIGIELEEARAIAAEASSAGVCAAANDNGGGQVVLSGAKAAIERAVELAKARGVKRAMMLPVSAPFHCPLM